VLFGFVDGGAQTGVEVGVAAAVARGHGDLADEPGEDLAAFGVLPFFAETDVRPFGMASHCLSCRVAIEFAPLANYTVRSPFPGVSAMNPAERNRRRLEWLRLHVFGPVYWSRGEDLVQRDRVRSYEFSGDEQHWHIEGRVQGTQRSPYVQHIDISWDEESDVKPSSIECSCTCPIGEACKHCAALLIEFGERLLEQETAEAETLDTAGFRGCRATT